MVRRIVEHHFGRKPKRITHQAGGLSNLVFLVQHPEGDLVVRMSPEQGRLNSYIKEQWATAHARKAGVPAPEVLEVGNEVAPMPYMVSRKCLGREAPFHKERMKIMREMGRYAALINSIRTKGFGSTFEWSRNHLSHNATWNEFLNSELKLEDRIKTLADCGKLPAPKLKTLRRILESAAGKGRHASLNHGDIRLKNVLVDDAGKISCFLDWEHCASNLAPEWELSVALHDLSIDEKQEFLAGYGLSETKLCAIAPVVKALNLIHYTPHLELATKEKDVKRLDQYRTRLSGALDLYSL